VALTGNPEYGIIMESYPFIARKLLSEDRPEIQGALQEVLYNQKDGNGALKFSRLLALLNNAAGSVSTQDGAAFVDLDTVPEDGISFGQGLKFLLSDKAESLRNLLEDEVDTIVDILSRQIIRKGATDAIIRLTPPRLPSLPFIGDIFSGIPNPKLDEIPLPLLLPNKDGTSNTPTVGIMTLKEFVDRLAPKLSQDEEIYGINLAEAATEFLGEEVAEFTRGEGVLSAKSGNLVLGAIRSGAFGQRDFLSNANVQNALETVGTLLNNLSSTSDINMEETLSTAMEGLETDERERLDAIVEELTRRSLSRAAERMSEVSRLL
jgi:hypothetical protein